jgi:predicted RNA binding protein YcfA (HicA-like mRNA interferase family)
VSGPELAKVLRVLGYQVSRQTGSHMRLTAHFDMTRDALVKKLFGKA